MKRTNLFYYLLFYPYFKHFKNTPNLESYLTVKDGDPYTCCSEKDTTCCCFSMDNSHYRLRVKVGDRQFYNSKKNIENRCKNPSNCVWRFKCEWTPYTVVYGWNGNPKKNDWNLCKAPSFYAGFVPELNRGSESAYRFRC